MQLNRTHYLALFYQLLHLVTHKEKFIISSQHPLLIREELRMAPINGTSLYCNVMGEGDPLVLITGEFFDSRMWDDQISCMAQAYKVLRYDLRGTGQSSRLLSEYSHTNDLAALLELLHIQHAHMLGIMQGANIALELALHHPEYVRSLIFVAASFHGYVPPHFPDRAMVEVEDMLTKLFAENSNPSLTQIGTRMIELNMAMPSFAPSTEHPAARQRAQTIMEENIPQSFDPKIQSVLWDNPPAVQRLSDVHVPTLVIVGERMPPDAHILADFLVKAMIEAQKVVIPDAPTLMNMDQPEAFNQVVLDFLQTVEIR